MCVQLALVAAERVTTPCHIIASTLGTLATRIDLVYLLDGDADITKREFESVNELLV